MDYEYVLMPNGELYHWGIKGMKWGIRRYQNKDGSLTPAGRKRYNDELDSLKAREKEIKGRERAKARQAKLDAKKAELDEREKALEGEKTQKKKTDDTTSKTRSVKDMTDEEIRTAIARKQLENQYLQYHPEPKKTESFGTRFVNDAVKPAVVNAGRDFIENSLKKVASNVLKDKVDPNSLAGLEAANKKLRAKIENELLKSGIDPNIKGENLEKWRKFKQDVKGDKSADNPTKNDNKSTGDNDSPKTKSSQDSKTADGKSKTTESKNKGSGTKRDEEPEIIVEGVGKSSKKTEKQSRPDPIIIDMEVNDLPAVYTDYGRNYVDMVVYDRYRRGGD